MYIKVPLEEHQLLLTKQANTNVAELKSYDGVLDLTRQNLCLLACACAQSAGCHTAQSHRTEANHHTTEAVKKIQCTGITFTPLMSFHTEHDNQTQ